MCSLANGLILLLHSYMVTILKLGAFNIFLFSFFLLFGARIRFHLGILTVNLTAFILFFVL